MSSTEIELNLSLDKNCRTTIPNVGSGSGSGSGSDSGGGSSSTSKAVVSALPMDYTSKTVMTSLADDSKIDMFLSAPPPSSSSSSSTTSSTSSIPSQIPSDSSPIPSTQNQQKVMDDLLFDCEITDCALLPRTFWMPCVGTKPRCALEQCALEVFYHHVKNINGNVSGSGNGSGSGSDNDDNNNIKNDKDCYYYDPLTSGAEWWVQIRPSPPAGRYKMLIQDKDDDNDMEKKKDKEQQQEQQQEVDMTRNGVCFHWDKDEDLRLLMDGKFYIHPHISTVTYLSNIGAPTVALNYRVNAFTGEYILPGGGGGGDHQDEHEHDNNNNNNNNNKRGNGETTVEGYVSWPKKGKHLSFDGRFLHAAPSDFMKRGLFEEQIKVPPLNNDNYNDNDNKEEDKGQQQQHTHAHTHTQVHSLEKAILERRHRRVTFLVNIWLNYKPFNVHVFPESMIDKMSKVDTNLISHILFKNDQGSRVEENRICPTEDHTVDLDVNTNANVNVDVHSECSPSSPSINTTKEKQEEKCQMYQNFKWSMGSNNCDEENDTLSMSVPIEMVRKQNQVGGNVRLSWQQQQTNDGNGKIRKKSQGISLLKYSKDEYSDTKEVQIKKQRLNS